MELHFVTGFLGAGKTTTIINCCKILMKQGKKVAVITNDQGKYLVDTAFMRAANIPAVDVQSGCFCSHYQDMLKQLEDLQEKVDPDIVFAEAIGSAANLVGTVMQPLIKDSKFIANSLSAVVDARFMLRLIQHQFLPFSDSITGTFKSQLNESNCLIINKIDIISKKENKLLNTTLPKEYPGKVILFQNANNKRDLEKWYCAITHNNITMKGDKGFDPQLHRRALNKLKWEESVFEFSHADNVFPDIIKQIDDMLNDYKIRSITIAHIKAFIEYDKKSVKISITSLDQDEWRHELEELGSKTAKMIINSRIQL